jgi:hypothetical protein
MESDGMILNFTNKKPEIKKETKAIGGFVIPKCILRIEPENMSLKERGDWYRKFLDCDNTLCFQLMGNYVDEACIIFDSKRIEIDEKTKLDYLYEDMKFKCHILYIGEISKDFIISIPDKFKEGDDLV